MSNLFTWFDGKKTYIAALVAVGLATAELLGYSVPESVYAIAGALGLVGLRLAVKNLE